MSQGSVPPEEEPPPEEPPPEDTARPVAIKERVCEPLLTVMVAWPAPRLVIWYRNPSEVAP